ncbi:hypothetical protein N9F50_00300 [Akkermansiaceae bacterium]|nr:hypothetical protein [Akkermansiaceae bacterium]
MNDFWISRYKLHSASALNAKSARSVFRGALIRKGSGFGCLHPWPELGDPTLEECLVDWSLPLSKQVLGCVAADGEAREKGVSLFKGLSVPKSHATLPIANHQAIEQAIRNGFSTVKIKAKGELGDQKKLIADFPNLKWRIDFNGTADLKKITNEVRGIEAQIDFIEDPIPYDLEKWNCFEEETGIALANDREVEAYADCGIHIIKPALNEVDPLMLRSGRKVVTSYMDHPVGQCFSAYEAARAGVSELCGLQTHGLFEKNAFTEALGALGAVGPEFQVPDGSGLGFDDLLEALDWEKI